MSVWVYCGFQLTHFLRFNTVQTSIKVLHLKPIDLHLMPKMDCPESPTNNNQNDLSEVGNFKVTSYSISVLHKLNILLALVHIYGFALH